MSPSRPSRSSAGAGQSNSKAVLAPADKLKKEVQSALTEDLAQDRYRSGFGTYDGFAYIAAEAYFHLAGGHDAGLQPMQLKYRGRSHWWLLEPGGRVVDLVLGPRETSKFPYHRGHKRVFRSTPAGISRRAQTVVERVNSARG